tara:strand:+ start:7084 stop:7785 length:702 start_codon:yes stop_codon:yes gene_type:complete
MQTNEQVNETGFGNPSIDSIKSRISQGEGLLKPYNYMVNIPHLSPEGNRELNDIIQETTLPSKTHATQPVYYGGPLKQIPYITTYPGTITMTLICTSKSKVRDELYKWLDSVVLAKEGLVNYEDNYIDEQMTMEITKPESSGTSEAIKYTLFKVFPDSINEITLSQNSQNDYVRITVVFVYRKWIKGKGIDQVLEEQRQRLNTTGPRNADEASLDDNPVTVGRSSGLNAFPGF